MKDCEQFARASVWDSCRVSGFWGLGFGGLGFRAFGVEGLRRLLSVFFIGFLLGFLASVSSWGFGG